MEAISKACHIPEDLQMKYQKWASPDCIPHEFKRLQTKYNTSILKRSLYTDQAYALHCFCTTAS